MSSVEILGMRVRVGTLEEIREQIASWAEQGLGRSVCVSNVYTCMQSVDSAEYRRLINTADLSVADGRPILWAQRLLGAEGAEQIRGLDLSVAVCQEAARRGLKLGLYGGTPDFLEPLTQTLQERAPGLEVVCAISPPFRPPTEEEDRSYVEEIIRSGTQILLVGIGCPKQERWMAAHRDRLPCVMLGVGAVFDFLSGRKPEAPRLLQLMGLEWLFRLQSEPRRLWRRYLIQNPRFLWRFSKQYFKG